MLRMKKSIILVVITLLILTAFCSLASAEEIPKNQDQTTRTTAQTWVNPIYADIETTPPSASSMQAMSDPEPTAIATMDELRSELTQGLANRDTTIRVVYTGSYTDLSSNDDIVIDRVDALLHSIFGSDDYLYFNLQNWSYGGGGSDGDFQITFGITYLTTLEQENYVHDEVDTILANLIAPHMNQHQKIKAIHDYIVTHVAYNEFPASENTPHSAYTALFDGEAVCQGYALLAYKMLTEAGFEARIIGGFAGNDADGWVDHAWNRVKLDGVWYNLDCTWDDPIPDVPGRVLYNYYHLTDTELETDHRKYAEYVDLPAANTSYFATLNGLIRDFIAAEDMDQTTVFLRLRQKLGLEYLFDEMTADSENELKTMLQTSLVNHDSAFSVRYDNSIGDINTVLNRIFDEIVTGTDLNEWSLSYQDFTLGGTSDYTLLEFSFVYLVLNQAPTAAPVAITGLPFTAERIRGNYDFADAENDGEALNQFQWYRAASADGTDKVAIPEAYAPFFILSSLDEGKYLFFEVTPVAATGTLQGSKVTSAPFGPIALQSVEAPTCNVAPGQVASGTEVSLSSATEGASIYYTVDGSDPTAASTLYENPIVLTADTTIKAIAIKDGMDNSNVAEFNFEMMEQVAAPSSNPAAGPVATGTEVILSSATEGASIYYTVDGSDPTAASTLYENPIVITADTTIKAVAIKDGMANSDPEVFAYTIASSTDECFIATAAFGTKFDWPVALLRHFRDQFLLTNDLGTAFVNFYYHKSPPIAAFIAQSEPLRVFVRILLAPIIAIVYLLYHPAAMAILLTFAAMTGYLLLKRRKTQLSQASGR